MADDKDLKQARRMVMWCLPLMIAVASLTACLNKIYDYAGVEKDNAVEEILEDLVEDHFNLPENSLDFTPGD